MSENGLCINPILMPFMLAIVATAAFATWSIAVSSSAANPDAEGIRPIRTADGAKIGMAQGEIVFAVERGANLTLGGDITETSTHFDGRQVRQEIVTDSGDITVTCFGPLSLMEPEPDGDAGTDGGSGTQNGHGTDRTEGGSGNDGEENTGKYGDVEYYVCLECSSGPWANDGTAETNKILSYHMEEPCRLVPSDKPRVSH